MWQCVRLKVLGLWLRGNSKSTLEVQLIQQRGFRAVASGRNMYVVDSLLEDIDMFVYILLCMSSELNSPADTSALNNFAVIALGLHSGP